MGRWSGWDIAIVALAASQIAALVALVVQLLRLAGNARQSAKRGAALAHSGKKLLGAGVALVTRSRARTENIVEQVSLTRDHYHRLTDRSSTDHLPIHWGRFFVALGTVRTARHYLHYAEELLARVRKQPAPAPRKQPRPARRPLLERAGLLPPLVTRLRPYLPYVGVARQVWRELQKRGVIGPKV